MLRIHKGRLARTLHLRSPPDLLTGQIEVQLIDDIDVARPMIHFHNIFVRASQWKLKSRVSRNLFSSLGLNAERV
jgi:hypothetical protein